MPIFGEAGLSPAFFFINGTALALITSLKMYVSLQPVNAKVVDAKRCILYTSVGLFFEGG